MGVVYRIRKKLTGESQKVESKNCGEEMDLAPAAGTPKYCKSEQKRRHCEEVPPS